MTNCWRNKNDKSQHDWLYVSILLSAILLYTVTVGFNVVPTGTSLLPNDVGQLSYTAYDIDITPAGWVFAVIWSLIFFFQFVWLIYNFICLFRTTAEGAYLYRAFDILPMESLVAFMVNNIMVIIWIFLYSNKYAGWALIPIVFSTLALHVTIFISFRCLYQNKKELANIRFGKVDIWLVRIIVQNSLGLFLTWLSLASNLNFAIFLGYNAGVNVKTSASIALGVILLVIIVYFVLENFIWQRYLLYMFTPWFVVLIALIGSISRNWNSAAPSTNNIISLVMLVIAFCFTVIKIVMFILYHTVLKNRVDGVICRSNKVHGSDLEMGAVKEGLIREGKRASDDIKTNPIQQSKKPAASTKSN